MGDVINLGKARKAKARVEAKAIADANRAKFGRTKAEKTRDAMEKTKSQRVLDHALIETE